MPIIELPELYYIQCEYFIEKGDINKAINTLKQLKDARGIKSPIEIKDYKAQDVVGGRRDEEVQGEVGGAHPRQGRDGRAPARPQAQHGREIGRASCRERV